jgi:hypothetical protein
MLLITLGIFLALFPFAALIPMVTMFLALPSMIAMGFACCVAVTLGFFSTTSTHSWPGESSGSPSCLPSPNSGSTSYSRPALRGTIVPRRAGREVGSCAGPDGRTEGCRRRPNRGRLASRGVGPGLPVPAAIAPTSPHHRTTAPRRSRRSVWPGDAWPSPAPPSGDGQALGVARVG